MKVLQFAFSPDCESAYLPKNHIPNSIVYTGTHDNDTLLGYLETTSERELNNAMSVMGIKRKKQIPKAMMKTVMQSVSNTAILTAQDLIGLGGEARMNTPAKESGNWQWRATKKQLSPTTFTLIKRYTNKFNRI